MNALKDLTTLEEIKEQLDLFIQNNKPNISNNRILNMRNDMLENGKLAYNHIKEKVPEKDIFYTQFGYTGTSSFYLYKNEKGEIYVIEIGNFVDIDSYFVIEDEDWFN
jgi:uncharacterized protein (AIM24 family)